MRKIVSILMAVTLASCGRPATSGSPLVVTATSTPSATRVIHPSYAPVSLGSPVELAALSGQIVFDDFEDVYAMNVDGSNLVAIANDPAGSEFDGSWAPDGEWIVYRDSTRGTNNDDEIDLVRADGTDRRNLTNNPSNDWGPDWSPDGTTIAFNSDRAGGVMGGYLMNPDGSNVRRIESDTWIEYPSWSPDSTKLAFMGALGSNYELFVIELATGEVTQLTDSPGHDAWPAWSPDGKTIAFTSVRDDCDYAPRDRECWATGDIGPHHDIWLIDFDGSNLRRVATEFGQFVAWSPDSQYLLISGTALYVVRTDGTGRLELRADGMSRSLGGLPDWR